jgi:hypothetical protein
MTLTSMPNQNLGQPCGCCVQVSIVYYTKYAVLRMCSECYVQVLLPFCSSYRVGSCSAIDVAPGSGRTAVSGIELSNM